VILSKSWTASKRCTRAVTIRHVLNFRSLSPRPLYAMLTSLCRSTPRRFFLSAFPAIPSAADDSRSFILPWFWRVGGGMERGAAVLSVCCFWRGYFYAHLLIRYAKPMAQFWIHAVLLTAALATLPIIPSAHWKPGGRNRSDTGNSHGIGARRWGFLILCSRRPVHCCKPGLCADPRRARFRIGCSRCRISGQCWRC